MIGEPETSQAANIRQGAKPSGSLATKKYLKRGHESRDRETAKRARQAGRPPRPLKEQSERGKLLGIPEIVPNIYVDGADV
jgi:hypothetical protein